MMPESLPVPVLDLEPSTLYLVGTPIGNPADLSPRAVAVLAKADTVLCEDTRVTGLLLSPLGLHPRYLSYHEHNRASRLPRVLAGLERGESWALVSDAGLPAISDPGQDLAAAVTEAGYGLSVIPGPVAGITALAASGLDTRRFVFEGFIPQVPSERRETLGRIAAEERTVILYESPTRVVRTLAELCEAGLGERRVVTGRELTKTWEEYRRGTISELLEWYQASQPKGEFVLILEGRGEAEIRMPPARPGEDEVIGHAAALLASGLDNREAQRRLQADFGLSRNEAYQAVLRARER